MKKLLVVVYIIFCYSVTFGQITGQWCEYFNYRNVTQIEAVDDNIFALSENGIFVYNTTTKELTKISKLTGLSSVGLTCMAYCDSTSSFIIGYEDGLIDILQYPSLKVQKIATIQKKTMYGSKSINAISVKNDTALIATAFGVVLFSMRDYSFISTTIMSNTGASISVNSISANNDNIYAATANGLYTTSLKNSNYSDFSKWDKISSHENDTITNVACLASSVYYSTNDSLLKLTNGTFEAFKVQFEKLAKVRSRNGILCVAAKNQVKLYDSTEKLLFAFDSIFVKNNYYDVLCDESGTKWVASCMHGLVETTSLKGIAPSGTADNYIIDVKQNEDHLHIASGTLWNSCAYEIKTRKNEWYGHENSYNGLSLHVVPSNGYSYMGSYAAGLVEYANTWDITAIYNQSNSILKGYYLDDSWTVVTDVASDKKGNVWMTNPSTDNPLVAKITNGDWYSYAIPRESSLVKSNMYNHVLVDKRGYKWLSGTSLLTVFYENGTFDDTSDDLLVQINLKDSEGTIADQTTCLAEDLEGEIWIGTTKGIAVHSSPARVFNDRQSISRIKIEIDDEVGYLLSSESISCITVDGANRKWIGTENSGVFLISDNGTEQILNFTKSNSYLPSNKITSIAIDGTTGEVAIGTDKGLVSYWADASDGASEMGTIYAVPNPVRESYDGNIYIHGLVTDAYVKITDVSGNLVNHAVANGGIAVWNGRNLYGNRVKTGVYLVYVSDEDGSNTKVTKIVFIN